MLKENAPPVDCPKAGVEPNRLGVLLGVEKLLPKRLDALEAPKAGVLRPPNRLEAEVAPNEGVLAPNRDGVLAATDIYVSDCVSIHIRGKVELTDIPVLPCSARGPFAYAWSGAKRQRILRKGQSRLLPWVGDGKSRGCIVHEIMNTTSPFLIESAPGEGIIA